MDTNILKIYERKTEHLIYTKKSKDSNGNPKFVS